MLVPIATIVFRISYFLGKIRLSANYARYDLLPQIYSLTNILQLSGQVNWLVSKFNVQQAKYLKSVWVNNIVNLVPKNSFEICALVAAVIFLEINGAKSSDEYVSETGLVGAILLLYRLAPLVTATIGSLTKLYAALPTWNKVVLGTVTSFSDAKTSWREVEALLSKSRDEIIEADSPKHSISIGGNQFINLNNETVNFKDFSLGLELHSLR